MKNYLKSLFFGVLFFSSISVSAQTVGGVPLRDLDAEYIRIYNGNIGWNTHIYIDFGRNRISLSNSKNNILRDDLGQSIDFQNMLDALNFLSKYGYELVQAYVAAYDDHRDVHYYILRRKQTP